MSLDDLGRLTDPQARRSGAVDPLRLSKPPAGLEPCVTHDAAAGEGTTRPRRAAEPEPDERAILEEFELDPALWQVTAIRKSRWQGFDGEMLSSFRASFVRRDAAAAGGSADLDELKREIRKLRAVASTPPPADGVALVVNLSDWQVGKGEGGGTPATINRVLQMGADVERRVKELRRIGRPITHLHVHGLGDLFEGTCGFYAMQEFSVDLDRRGQANVIRRLLLELLRRWGRLGLSVVVATVGGNHGENRDRQAGKAYTTFADNDDVAVFEQVADVVAENPEAFGSPTFVIPTDRLSFTLDACGTPIAVAHGHQFTGGGKLPQAKALEWWRGQTLGRQPAAHALILTSAHYHHFSVVTHGPRTHFQTPALDGGSKWWTDTSGMESPTGTLTFLAGAACGPLGWQDVQIL